MSYFVAGGIESPGSKKGADASFIDLIAPLASLAQ